MDAESFDLAAAWRPTAKLVRGQLGICASLLLIASLAMTVALVAARRLAGGLEEPLSPAAMAVAAAFASLLAAAARLAMPSDFPIGGNQAAAMVARWLPLPLLAIWIAALWLPGTSVVGIAIAWCIVAAEELLSLRGFRTAFRRRSVRNPVQATAEDRQLPLAVSRVEPPLSTSSLAPPLAPPQSVAISPEVVQQLSRSRTADGLDRLTGWLQMPLTTGERNATAHVAFCPPFPESPRISLRQTAGPAGRVRAVQILPHGVRLELKLDFSPRQPQRVSVEFVAESRL